ncbi:unnamed protein product [Bursaphelenchus xylophilus]|uniref:(pine wood nematode) hypothetical protein n=1 Tax=Bursaphelenchus xylophilus TaxID=6326 RepID=A0A1I7RNE1_BURXY|nr:unnamed protein product [Bursaphelenchus xylophilus]CAG9123921.1 unnamed protein product [Bursaphelenchus xylophilus]
MLSSGVQGPFALLGRVRYLHNMVAKPIVPLALTSSLVEPTFDGVIVVSHSLEALTNHAQFKVLAHQLTEQSSHGVLNRPGFLLHTELPSKRLFYSPVSFGNHDFDDIRKYRHAGEQGIALALSSGVKNPLLAVVPNTDHPNALVVAALGVFHKLHVPLNIRQEESNRSQKVERLGVLSTGSFHSSETLKLLDALQSSFAVCRDIGDTDPQRMAPGPAASYVQEHFKGTEIKVTIEDNVETLKKEFPLLAAVSRGCNHIDPHKARLLFLEYENREDSGKPFETIFLIGKGVTLDTGGLDLKVNGAMLGMSRDKYGSAVVAGFFDALDKLKPKGLKVVGLMAMVRNSCGSASYSCDEIITSRSGKRILIGNTDAEGRLAMLDPLTYARELALKEDNPHLYTLATLTGHEVLAYGYFPAIIDNAVARSAGHAQNLQKVGDEWGQPLEVSRLHVEDFDFNKSPVESADLRQANNRPSVQTLRGHQSPCAFLIQASRLDEHGISSQKPIRYSHIDIGSSMGEYPATTFPCPLLALSAKHIFPRLS